MWNRYCFAALAIWSGAACLGGCGASDPNASKQRRQKTIREKIDEEGGAIYCKSNEEISAATLETVRGLGLRGALPDDKAWTRLSTADRLEAISFGNSEISPDVSARVSGLKSLRSLTFQDCKIPPSVWAKLKGSDIEELSLVDETFDDASLEVVSSMPKLRLLMIGCPKVSSAAIDRFEKAHKNIKLDLLSY